MKKTFPKIFMAKTKEATPVKTVPELPGINIYYHSSLLDTDFAPHFVPTSNSMPLACTFKKFYSLTRNSGYPNKITFRKIALVI